MKGSEERKKVQEAEEGKRGKAEEKERREEEGKIGEGENEECQGLEEG